ncbi:MAG: general secretion pathway protein GspK [Nitrospirae bacterium]|nr:general secretion pathway protein GspK [Nitrospirota bacterium]
MRIVREPRNMKRGDSNREKGGVAFNLVLWIIVMLLVIVGEFSNTMRSEINITRNFKEEEEAYQFAVAGVEQAKVEILSLKENPYVYYNNEGVLTFSRGINESSGGTEEGEMIFKRDIEIGKGSFKYTIIDETGRLNLNTASLSQLKHVIGSTGVKDEELDIIVDSIIDWRDPNDLHMANGAEEDYYRSLPEPYSCKDAAFESLEELLLVRGVTPEIFYGSAADSGDKNYEGIKDYFTVWGSNYINIGTSPRIVLEAVFGVQTAGDILAGRASGLMPSAIPGGSMSSGLFTVIATGFNSGKTIKRSVKATVQKIGTGIETIYWNDNYAE